MALTTIAIEGTGVIADCDDITDNQGGTWFELGGGTVAQSTDVYFIRSASIGGKYAGKSGIHAIDKGSALYDFTSGGAQEGELIYIWVSMTALGTLDTLANYGLCVRVSSGGSTNASSNYLDFVIAGSNDTNGWTGGWKCFVIDPTMTPSRYDGTIATILANVRTIGLWIDCSGSARADSIFVNEIAIGKGIRVTGGTSTTGWKDIVDYCTAYATRGWGMWQEREGIYYSYGKTYVGDSTQTVTLSFKDTSRIIQFGISEYYESAAWRSSLPVTVSGIAIEDASGYTTVFEDGVIVGSDGGRSGSTFVGNSQMDVSVDLYGGGDGASTTKLYGTILKALTGSITWGNDSDHVFYGGSIIGCGQFDPVGAVILRNLLIAETSNADAALLWNENINIQIINFIANTVGAAIEHESAAGTPYSYTRLYFSDNTNDVLNSATALTVNKAGTPTSDPTSYEGATVTFSGSVSVTVTVYDEDQEVIVGARVGVYTNDVSRTQIVYEVTSGIGVADDTWSGGTPQSVEVRVRKASTGGTKYIPFSQIASISSSGLTLDVTLRADSNA